MNLQTGRESVRDIKLPWNFRLKLRNINIFSLQKMSYCVLDLKKLFL